MAHPVAFWFALVGFWFARSDCRVVIGENKCWFTDKSSPGKPLLPQIKGSKRKSTVDLGETTVDSGLGFVCLVVMRGGKWAAEVRPKKNTFLKSLE
ncbi:MAG TPA: hypothetical protein VK811_07190 [Candidatus Acidoferrum sp.]|jgi:hypothetical protein|nr:hypothetical protein [Candidatus Acidoferrum sp.]